VSHIMLRRRVGEPTQDSLAKEKIYKIYKSLQAGAGWDSLCRIYSEHKVSRSSGGKLPWFSGGRMPLSFEKAAYTLKQKGSFSAPIRTAYGWHLLRLDSTRALRSYAQLKAGLLAHLRQDSTRLSMITQAYYEILQEEQQWKESAEKPKILAAFDQSLSVGQWKMPQDKALLNQPLGFTAKESIPIPAVLFYRYALAHQKAVSLDYQTYAKLLYTFFVRELLQTRAEAMLDRKYPEYKRSMQQFTEAVLATELKKRAVWDKAAQDKVGLNAYFAQHKAQYAIQYQVQGGVEAQLFQSKDQLQLHKAVEAFQQGTYLVRTWEEYPLFFENNNEQVFPKYRKILTDVYKLHQGVLGSNIKVTSSRSQGVSDAAYKQYCDRIEKAFRDLGVAKEHIQFVCRQAGTPQPGHACRFTLGVQTKGMRAIPQAFEGVRIKNGFMKKSTLPAGIALKPGVQQFESDGIYYWVNVQDVQTDRPKTLEEIKGFVIRDYQQAQEKSWMAKLRKAYKVKILPEGLRLLQEMIKKTEAK